MTERRRIKIGFRLQLEGCKNEGVMVSEGLRDERRGRERFREKNCSQDHSNIFSYRNRGVEREREREVELMFFPSPQQNVVSFHF